MSQRRRRAVIGRTRQRRLRHAIWIAGTLALAGPTGSALALTDAEAVRPVPALARPAAGASFPDPAFGTRLRRVSALAERPCAAGCPFEVPTYSQLQAFNTDGSLMLLSSSDGYRVRRVSDLLEVRRLRPEIEAPRWHPRKATVLVHFDRPDDRDVSVEQTDVTTGRTRRIATLRRYVSIARDQSLEELSRDGRWLAGLAQRPKGRREVFSFDLVRRRFGATLSLNKLCGGAGNVPGDPDWVAASPLGRYLVIQWKRDGTERCSGLEAYRIRRGGFAGRIVPGHGHGDLGLASGGREVFMTGSDHPDDPNLAGLAWYELPGAPTSARPHYVQLLDWHALMSHVSCQGPPGVCLVTSVSDLTASCCGEGWQPFQQEVWLQYLEGGGRPNYAPVRRLAHHRSSERVYWDQPHATLSRDGRYALFGSDWGIDPGRERADPYLVELAPAAGSG